MLFFTVRKSSDISVYVDILLERILPSLKHELCFERAVFSALCLNDYQFVSQITPGVVQLF